MSKTGDEKPGPRRTALAKPKGLRSAGFLSHGGQDASIPRGADGAPRKARGIRDVATGAGPTVQQLDQIPVKDFSLTPEKRQRHKGAAKPAPLNSTRGRTKP